MKEVSNHLSRVIDELGRVVVGQRDVIKELIVAILCDSNVLLESYPGLGKTTLVKTLSEIMRMSFSRIQSTPDLMPTDITGTYVLEEKRGKREFSFHQGPIFANIVLVDEINRATPKSQSALLEAMQEKQITLGNNTFMLDRPFFVLATQNPIEQEGTYPLPEAQTDRFLLKIKIDYPTIDEEGMIIDRFTGTHEIGKIKSIMTKKDIFRFQSLTRQVPISKDIRKQILQIIQLTRKNKKLIEYGASPRASLGLVLASKAHALMEGRNYVSKADVKRMVHPILRHRIILSFEAERKGFTTDDVIDLIVNKT